MTQDIQLTHRCPHVTVEDRVFLQADRRTLALSQSLGSSATVRLVANGIQVPGSGYHSQARLVSGQSGPYRIVSGENTVTVRSSTQVASLELPVSSRVSAQDVARQIRQAMSSLSIDVVRGHLSLIDTSNMGRSSLVQVKGDAAASLGFVGVAGARGRQVYPPWQVVRDRTSTDPRDLTIRFTQRVRQNPIFKATYVVRPDRCKRCQSSLIENDYRFNSGGDALLIEDQNLLYQECLKIILTERGSNPFHTFYGTALHEQIGSKAIAAAASFITEDVRRALENLRLMQEQQGEAQEVSRGEKLYRVVRVSTKQEESTPTLFNLEVIVANAARQTVTIPITFTVPDVVALDSTGDLVLNPEYAGLTTEEQRNRLFGG